MSATSVGTITVNMAQKTVSYSGVMSIREKVGVTITGATGSTAAGLHLRVLEPAGFAEMAKCVTFAASGDDFVGTLDLSGTALAAEFTGDAADKVRVFVLQCFNHTDDADIITDRVMIMNNPLTSAIQSETPTTP